MFRFIGAVFFKTVHNRQGQKISQGQTSLAPRPPNSPDKTPQPPLLADYISGKGQGCAASHCSTRSVFSVLR
jgi:hypothetical protein